MKVEVRESRREGETKYRKGGREATERGMVKEVVIYI
jgi:hypothetical protein